MLKAYNEQIETAEDKTKLLDDIFGNSPIKEYAKKAEGAKVELEKFTTTTKAASIGLKALNIAFTMVVTAAISYFIQGVIKASKETETLRSNIKTVGESLSNTKSDINSYKQRIEELNNKLNDNAASYEDIISARSDLYDIQDELIKKYGNEEDSIKAVTDAINGQADALDRLTEKEFYRQLKDLQKEQSFVDQYFNDAYQLANYGLGTIMEDFSDLGKNWWKYPFGRISDIPAVIDDFTDVGYESAKSSLDKMIDEINAYKLPKIYLDTDKIFNDNVVTQGLNDIYEKRDAIQSLLSNSEFYDLDENRKASLNDELTLIKSTISAYEDFYNQYLLFEKINKDPALQNYLSSLTKLESEYKKAFADNNELQKTDIALQYGNIINEILSDSSISDDVKSYYKRLYPSLLEASEDAFINSVNDIDIQKEFGSILDKFKQYSTEDLFKLNISDLFNLLGEDDFNKLDSYIYKYFDSNYEAFYNWLQNKGQIYSRESQLLIDTIGDKVFNQLSDKDKQYILKFNESRKEIEEYSKNNPIEWYLTTHFNNNDIDDLFNLYEESKDKEIALGYRLTKFNDIAKALGVEYDDIISYFADSSNSDKAHEALRFFDDLVLKAKLANVEIKDISYTESIQSVESFTKTLDTLMSVYDDVKNAEDFNYSSILNNDDFAKLFKDYTEEYENFIKVITQSPSDIEACQEAFNELATAALYGGGALDKLIDESSEAAISLLQQHGIANAAEIVTERLNQLNAEREYYAKTGDKVADATAQEIVAFSNMAEISDETRKALNELWLKEVNVANFTITTSATCNNIYNIAKAAGASTEQLSKLAEASEKMAQLEAQIDTWKNSKNKTLEATYKIAELRGEINKLAKDANTTFTDIQADLFKDRTQIVANTNGSYSGRNGKDSSSSSTEDAWKKEFDDYYSRLKHALAMNLITEEEYYATLDKLNKQYFADRKEYLSEYRQYEEEVYNGLKNLQTAAIKNLETLRDKVIEMIKKQKETEIDAIKETIKAEEEKLEKLKEEIDARKEAINKAKEEEDYAKGLAEKNKKVTDIELELNAIRYDDSATAARKRRELEEQLAEAQEDLEEYITDHAREQELERLDQQVEDAEKATDAKKTELEKQIDEIEKYLNDQLRLQKDAMKQIEGFSDTLYGELVDWNEKYGDGIQSTVTKAWNDAKTALEDYNTSAQGVQDVYDDLASNEALEKLADTSDVLAQVVDVGAISHIVDEENGNVPTTSYGGNTSTNTSTSTPATSAPSTDTRQGTYGSMSSDKVKDVVTVQGMEQSLWNLAEKYYGDGTQWTKIQAANGGVDPTTLHIGDKILIPFKSGGYTGNDEGIAYLHRKEYVLNEKQTQPVLEALPKLAESLPSLEKLIDLGNILAKNNIRNIMPNMLPNSNSVTIGDININGNMGNLTVSDLNKFRKDIVDNVFEQMNKNRLKSGR